MYNKVYESQSLRVRALKLFAALGGITLMMPSVAFAAPVDSTPPAVSITSPSNTSTISGTVMVTAGASDMFSSCVVTLFGQLYDVSSLQSTHSGGNVFTCGTDMTAVYQSQHGTNLSRVQSLLIPSTYVGVVKVEFYVDGNLVSTDTSSPYSHSLDTTTLSNGAHVLMAKAYDDSGNITNSANVNVTVNNAPPPPTDNTAPTTVLTAPSTGTVSGLITLSATASDNVGIDKVQFYLDGVLYATDNTSPYSTTLDTTTLSNGNHLIWAKAFDTSLNVGNSSSVYVTVNNPPPPPADTTPPVITLISPANGSTVSGTITVSAAASDNVGVTKVEVYVDGNLKSTDTTSPYSVSLNTNSLSNGTHTLTVKAHDAAGNSTTSAQVSIRVSNNNGNNDNDEDDDLDEDNHEDEDHHLDEDNHEDEDDHLDEDHHEDEDDHLDEDHHEDEDDHLDEDHHEDEDDHEQDD